HTRKVNEPISGSLVRVHLAGYAGHERGRERLQVQGRIVADPVAYRDHARRYELVTSRREPRGTFGVWVKKRPIRARTGDEPQQTTPNTVLSQSRHQGTPG